VLAGHQTNRGDLVFAQWDPLVEPAGLAVVGAGLFLWIPRRAEVFGDLLEAAFDLYRIALDRQLRWPLPPDPKHERAEGRRLRSYLWRGSDASRPIFTPAEMTYHRPRILCMFLGHINK
jgi:hypothetical protein